METKSTKNTDNTKKVILVSKGYHFELTKDIADKMKKLIKKEKFSEDAVRINHNVLRLGNSLTRYAPIDAIWRENPKLISFFEENPIEGIIIVNCGKSLKIGYNINMEGLVYEVLV